MQMNRSSGILLHLSSLPGPFGIGDLGPEACAFVDRLAEAGQSIWQVLPLGPTGYGDSPYAPFSTFAGNELLISPELLEKDGLLTAGELADAPSFPEERVDFGAVRSWKTALLDRAAERFVSELATRAGRWNEDFARFHEAEKLWLDDYALFMAVKGEYDALALRQGGSDSSWNVFWPRPLALRKSSAIAGERARRFHSIQKIEALQYFFFSQWRKLKAYANSRGISIIGDIPIFVALDSADVWTHPELFCLDAELRPVEVAGVPPDYFSEDGQRWGNPVYNWRAHEREGFSWWIRRIASALARYDYVRVDHFRGFASYWAVPASEKTARNGCWRPSPGSALFSAVRKSLGSEVPIIAEDLGFITEDVRRLRDDLGLPGMRILQFAFDASESGTAFDPHNAFLPHNYIEHCLVYTGTHDNNTLAGWLASASPAERDYVDRYLDCRADDRVWAMLRAAWSSVAAWSIAPMQDLLGLGSGARMNVPSTVGGNWTWRLAEGAFDPALARRLRDMTALYGRAPQA